VSRPDLGQLDDSNRSERWCNSVAAELLVPLQSIRGAYRPEVDLTAELERLAKFYKVSTLVVLRRIVDAELMDRPTYYRAYNDELPRILELAGAPRRLPAARVEEVLGLRGARPPSRSRFSPRSRRPQSSERSPPFAQTWNAPGSRPRMPTRTRSTSTMSSIRSTSWSQNPVSVAGSAPTPHRDASARHAGVRTSPSFPGAAWTTGPSAGCTASDFARPCS
jgi:hypothetical protein